MKYTKATWHLFEPTTQNILVKAFKYGLSVEELGQLMQVKPVLIEEMIRMAMREER